MPINIATERETFPHLKVSVSNFFFPRCHTSTRAKLISFFFLSLLCLDFEPLIWKSIRVVELRDDGIFFMFLPLPCLSCGIAGAIS